MSQMFKYLHICTFWLFLSFSAVQSRQLLSDCFHLDEIAVGSGSVSGEDRYT